MRRLEVRIEMHCTGISNAFQCVLLIFTLAHISLVINLLSMNIDGK